MTQRAELPVFPLKDHLGFRIEVPEPGHAVATIEVTPELWNPHGVLHGGSSPPWSIPPWAWP